MEAEKNFHGVLLIITPMYTISSDLRVREDKLGLYMNDLIKLKNASRAETSMEVSALEAFFNFMRSFIYKPSLSSLTLKSELIVYMGVMISNTPWKFFSASILHSYWT